MTAPTDEPPLLANGLPRPQPPPTARERVETLVAQVTDRLGSRPSLPGSGLAERSENRPVLVTMLAAATAAITTVCAVWLWQSWVARPTPDIDDLIPLAEPVDVAAASENNLESRNEQASASTVEVVKPDAADGDKPAVAPAGVGEQTDVTSRTARSTDYVAVHIAGAVAEPGVVYLAPGARVIDAVIAGGGAASSADLDRLNLALLVEDGQQIYVPRSDEEVPATAANSQSLGSPSDAPTRSGGATPSPLQLDLNRVTELELQSLPGIGPTMAAAIVGYRDSVGGFVAVDELVNVSGIGPTRLETIRPLVTVDGQTG